MVKRRGSVPETYSEAAESLSDYTRRLAGDVYLQLSSNASPLPVIQKAPGERGPEFSDPELLGLVRDLIKKGSLSISSREQVEDLFKTSLSSYLQPEDIRGPSQDNQNPSQEQGSPGVNLNLKKNPLIEQSDGMSPNKLSPHFAKMKQDLEASANQSNNKDELTHTYKLALKQALKHKIEGPRPEAPRPTYKSKIEPPRPF